MKYCAFLRGVNVNGTSMKMAEVCKVFADAGLSDVSSVLATGNILFSSSDKALDLKKNLEKAMSEYFNYDAFLFIKTEKEVAQMVEGNPFEKSENLHIYIFTGTEGIENILLDEFKIASKTDSEKGEVVGETFYWQVPKGDTLGSSFGKILGKKSLKDKMTSRNLNTMEKIFNKFQ
ncbi:DUF1697 domain-containing protein [Chryseobacterium sp.]|uniref:DUF1697 domain-containing protein n=1 Tax=Chryseobacterium sp. TaxID=1871047 RepID=UPI0011CAD19F|nr:DUF1697 domain-containing protein [Chryseobacterium sp.]TXF79375.1 DUF1697 domain-containing protein [Chryseobacterium sp.]